MTLGRHNFTQSTPVLYIKYSSPLPIPPPLSLSHLSLNPLHHEMTRDSQTSSDDFGQTNKWLDKEQTQTTVNTGRENGVNKRGFRILMN